MRAKGPEAVPAAAFKALRLVPIPITPSKPLTPSHLKGLLWVDLLERATRLVRPVTHDLNRTVCDLSCQTLDFWSWLEGKHLALDYASIDDVAVGRLYVQYHSEARVSPSGADHALIERVENGWTHPISSCLIEIWKDQYALLGIRDPGLSRRRRPALSREEVLSALDEVGLLLDHRHLGGSAFLDLTDQGLPLRPLLDPQGRDNYLLSILRELAPIRHRQETVALLCDKDVEQDFLLLCRTLRALSVDAFSLSIERVRLPGVGLGSARHGGWEEYTVSRFAERFLSAYGLDVFRLGLRLYFIVAQGPGCREPLRFDLIERCMRRARGLLAGANTVSRDAGLACLKQVIDRRGFADPYRVASLLLSPRTEQELKPWIRELFL